EVAGVKRTDLMPEVATMKEAGVEGVEVPLWFGLLAPAATPREVVQVLASGVAKAARSPDLRQRLIDQGADPVGNSPEEFERQLRDEVARWHEVVKVSGAKADRPSVNYKLQSPWSYGITRLRQASNHSPSGWKI